MRDVLHLHRIEFRYSRRQPLVVNDIDLAFEPGTTTAIVGPSGCGKSTLLYIAGLMLRPTCGDVLIDQESTRGLTDRARSVLRGTKIGFVFQDAMLDATRSVLDNVMEGAAFSDMSIRTRRQRAHELIEQFGVVDRRHARAADLSGGQAQRVGLCRALIKNPSIILADEPSGNLDPANGTLILDRLLVSAHDELSTVVVVTHDTALAQSCDSTVQLELR